MGAARILIVEDDAILATHKEDTLIKLGYQVIGIASTGEQAVDMAFSQQPDIILMDIRLHGEMTGIQTAEVIHDKVDIPIIYLSAYTDDLLVEQAKMTEPYAYLAKPVGDRELRASLEMALYKHRAEQLVRQERDRVQQYLDIAGVVILVLDGEGKIVLLNRRGYELLGYQPGELDGKNWTDTCAPACLRVGLNQTFHKLITGEIGSVEFFENPVLTKSGKERQVAWHNTLIRDELGNIVGTLSSGEDITERKQAEAALKSEQYLMKSLMDNIPDAIYFKDLESRFIRINQATADKHGEESPEQAIGKTDFDYFAKESAQAYSKDEQEMIRTGIPVVNLEEEELWPGRPSTWSSTTKMPLYDETGKVIGTFGISRDITGRKKAEGTFKKHTAQLELLNEIAHQVGQAHAVEDVMQRAVNLTQELLGYQHVGIFTLDQERKALVMRARAGAFATLFPDGYKLSFGQGMVGWVCQNGRSLLANDVEAEPSYINRFPEMLKTRSELTVPIHQAGHVLGVLDIQSVSLNAFDSNDQIVMETLADQVSVALENARLMQSLESELGEKEVLLREIHHRVKNNLEVVLSLADMQARRVDDVRAQQSLHILQERIRTIALVHESLYRSPSLSNIQAQKYLQQLTGNLYSAFGTAGINLLVQAEDIVMSVDMAMPCGLIVTELVTNAFKYAFPAVEKDGREGPGEISKEIRISLKQENQQIVLQVSDNGVGLPEGLNWQTSKALGLRLVTSLTAQLHGSLEMHNQEGTQFRVTFPAQEGVES